MSGSEAGESSTFDGSPGHDPLPDPPTWPKTVGITSIVWGAIGLTCSGCGAGMLAAMPWLMFFAEKEIGSPMPDALKPGPFALPLSVVGVGWAVLLIVAGILCVGRKPAARPAHLVYAIGGVILAALGAVSGTMDQLHALDWVAQNPTDGWARQHNATVGWIMLVFFVGLGTVWPLFCLVWFGALKRSP